jgi:putative acetyltransferase
VFHIVSLTASPGEERLEQVRRLFRQYADSLGFDLGFQGFEQELAGLPGDYAPPRGRLLLAHAPGEREAAGLPAAPAAAGGPGPVEGAPPAELMRGGLEPAGCVALRPLEAEICEMKRLFVLPGFRGRGLGRLLAERIIAEARLAGYRRMRLDTIAWMEEALGLYRSLGFRQIPPYRYNPIPDTRYLEMDLAAAAAP